MKKRTLDFSPPVMSNDLKSIEASGSRHLMIETNQSNRRDTDVSFHLTVPSLSPTKPI